MARAKYYVLVFATKQDRAAGDQAYEFDCSTLDEAWAAADSEVGEGNYAASIYERSGTAKPSTRIATHLRPQFAA